MTPAHISSLSSLPFLFDPWQVCLRERRGRVVGSYFACTATRVDHPGTVSTERREQRSIGAWHSGRSWFECVCVRISNPHPFVTLPLPAFFVAVIRVCRTRTPAKTLPLPTGSSVAVNTERVPWSRWRLSARSCWRHRCKSIFATPPSHSSLFRFELPLLSISSLLITTASSL